MLSHFAHRRRAASSQQGFTLIELLITLALFGILMFLALPSMQEMMNNNQVRTTADTVQNGLRQAKAEAIRRSKTTVFFLTDDTEFAQIDQNTPAAEVEVATTASTLGVEGRHWGIFTASGHGKPAELIEAGLQPDSNSQVRIRGPQAVCFNSLGRMVARTNDELDVGDAACPASSIASSFEVRMNDSTRNLIITVSPGGSIRMCDPTKTQTVDAC